MTMLHYVPKDEFGRLRALECPAPERAALFADACRLNTLYMIARAGSGHIGSSFSSLDIVSWLYLEELRPGDTYFSSKGHDAPGFYAVLTALGIVEFDKIHALRRLDGLPGHPDVHVPGMATNTGSLGMGVSKAKGMARAARLAGRDERLYVLTGDGELQEGQFWESLPQAVNHGLAEITVIVDHNRIQSDIWVAQTSDLGDLQAKFAAFGWHVQRVDGHDGAALGAALAAARAETARPSVIVADTVKGRGVSFMAHAVPAADRSLYRFHSGAPSREHYEAAVAELRARIDTALAALGAAPLALVAEAEPRRSVPAAPQRLVPAYAQALVALADRRADVVALDADLKLDCGLIPFEERYPGRFIECGIAEQDMVSQAGGLALRGRLPVVHSFACFLTPRANEQIFNNATEQTHVIYCGFLAGLLPAGPGHSHQSVRDIAALGAIPGLVMAQPADEAEVGLLLDYLADELDGPCYLRMVNIPCDVPYTLPEGYAPARGRGCLLRQGQDALIVAYGPVMLAQACKAAELLEAQHGVRVAVANLPWLNEVDAAWLAGALEGCRVLVTVDDHSAQGGQGEMLATALARTGLARRVGWVGLGVEGISACGWNDEILAYHGLDAASIAARVLAALDHGGQG